MEKSSILKNVYIFKDLTEDELDKIKNITELIQIETGQKLFCENDESDALYNDLDELIKEEPKIASKIYKAIALTLSKRLIEMSNNIEKRFQPSRFLG